MARCNSLTKRGTRCTKHAKAGCDKCPVHAPTGNENPGGPAPTKISTARLEAIRLGYLTTNTESGAARAAGVHRATLSRWKREGAQDVANGDTDTDCARLLDVLEEARDELIAEYGAQLQAVAIARGDTHTMLRILAQLDPDTWAKKTEHRHAGIKDAPPIAIAGPPPTQVVHMAFGADLEADVADVLSDED